MPTAVKHGFGTLLKKGATTIAEVVSISGPGMERDAIDATSTDSANNAREFIGGLTNGGEVEIGVNFLPGNATQKDLYKDELWGGTTDTWTIAWSDTPGTNDWTFSAFVIGFAPEMDLDAELSATIKLKITGKPTFPV